MPMAMVFVTTMVPTIVSELTMSVESVMALARLKIVDASLLS